jgi:hypothetical protein
MVNLAELRGFLSALRIFFTFSSRAMDENVQWMSGSRRRFYVVGCTYQIA